MKFASTEIIIFSAVATSATDSSLRRRKISEDPSIENSIQQESSGALNDGLDLHLRNINHGRRVKMVDFEFNECDDDDYDINSGSDGKGIKTYDSKGDKKWSKPGRKLTKDSKNDSKFSNPMDK